MNKLLHERLRDFADSSGCKGCNHLASMAGSGCDEFDTCTDCINAVTTALADEIEKYYIPRPRFEDGEPVQVGDAFVQKMFDEETVLQKIGIALYGKLGNMVWFSDEVVQRPEPKVLDADGVEINVGDTVWGKYSGVEHEVIGFDTCDGFLCVSIRNVETGSTGGASPNLLTHREPNSLEKLYSDMRHDETVKDEYIDRLAALLERDA